MHEKCVNGIYPDLSVQRGLVPADKTSWSTEFTEYAPVQYTSPVVLAQPVWADGPVKPADSPKNPMGRTGVEGRGLLGRWGPNFAADPIVSRLHKPIRGQRLGHDECLILRGGQSGAGEGEWAIPGGMVDARIDGGNISATLAREFTEEALSAHAPDQGVGIDVKRFFASGVQLYKGYVDDPRNTDDAWMETVVWSIVDVDGSFLASCGFAPGVGRVYSGGDDAAHVKMVEYTADMRLFASHADFLRMNDEHIQEYYGELSISKS